MPSTSMIDQLAKEASQQEVLAVMAYYLAAMLEKMPRLDNLDRVVVNSGEQGNTIISVAANQLIRMDLMGTSQQVTDTIPRGINNAGALHIYNQLQFTP